MNRRGFAEVTGSLVAATAVGCRPLRLVGSATRPLEGRGISEDARLLHQRATVVDANLSSPIPYDVRNPAFTRASLAPALVDAVQRSGLAATKVSVGGFDASFEDTVSEVAALQRAIEAHSDLLLQVRRVEDIDVAKRSGKLGIILSFESVTALGGTLAHIGVFRALGVRVMQLAYNTESPFGAGVLSPAGSGLTELGRAAVSRMNELGVAIDLSHANEATTTAATAASSKPVLITHGGCAAIYAHPRNKTDQQLRLLADKGGVFGVYDLLYLTPSPRQPTVDDYMAHLTHALRVCGEDHVGIGSDTSFDALDLSSEARARFDRLLAARRAAGVAAPEEDRMPYTEGLNRPDRTLVIAGELVRRGYPSRVVEKVLGANFVRAFHDIW